MDAAPVAVSRSPFEAADPEVLRQLDLDLPRTAGSDVALQACIGRVRTMILQHLEDDPELGYCQGMTLVAAVFAAAEPEDAEAYERFSGFIRRVRGLWLPGFPLLPPSTSCFEALAKNNAWFAHFARYGLLTDMFLPQALLSMFVNWLPLRTLLHCLDFLEEGLAALLSLALAVLELKESQLLQLQSFEELMEALQGLKESQISSSVLLERAEAGFAQASEVLLDCEGSPIVRLKKIQRKGSRVVDEEGNDILASAPGNLPNNLEWIAQESPTSVSDWWEGHSPLNLGASLFRWAFPDCEVCRAPGGVHHEPSG